MVNAVSKSFYSVYWKCGMCLFRHRDFLYGKSRELIVYLLFESKKGFISLLSYTLRLS